VTMYIEIFGSKCRADSKSCGEATEHFFSI